MLHYTLYRILHNSEKNVNTGQVMTSNVTSVIQIEAGEITCPINEVQHMLLISIYRLSLISYVIILFEA